MKKSRSSDNKRNDAKVTAEDKRKAAAEKRSKSEAEKNRRKAELDRARKARAVEREKLRAAKAKLARERLKKRQKLYARLKLKLKNRPQGFDYNGYGLLPRVEIITEGDRASIAAKFGVAGITASDMRFVGGKTRFKIRKKDLRKAIAILDEMCYNYQTGDTFGIGRKCAFWAARAGLIIGAVASAVFLNIAYGYVWRIEISGNDKLSAAAVESALKSAGISVGKKKSELSASRVVSALGKLDGIVDASCEIAGTTLRVRVLESEDYAIHEKSGAYVSAYDATVTRIVMRSGTAVVKRGDVVGAGDALASGDVYSTTGELLYTDECDAEVYGNVSVTFVAEVSDSTVEYKRTGRRSDKTVFELFGCRLGKARSPYRSYETVAHTANYNVLIPLYVTTYSFYETAAVERERDVKEAAEAYAATKIEEMRFIGDFEYSYNIRPSDAGLYSVHLFLSGETLISRGVDRIDPPSQSESRKD